MLTLGTFSKFADSTVLGRSDGMIYHTGRLTIQKDLNRLEKFVDGNFIKFSRRNMQSPTPWEEQPHSGYQLAGKQLGRKVSGQSWQTPHCPWGNSVLLWQRRLMISWAALCKILPALQAGWFVPSTQHQWSYIWSTVSFSGLLSIGRHGHTERVSPLRECKNDERTRASLLWGEGELAKTVQAGEEKNLIFVQKYLKGNYFRQCPLPWQEATVTKWNKGYSIWTSRYTSLLCRCLGVHWHRLPRETVESPYLEILKS